MHKVSSLLLSHSPKQVIEAKGSVCMCELSKGVENKVVCKIRSLNVINLPKAPNLLFLSL